MSQQVPFSGSLDRAMTPLTDTMAIRAMYTTSMLVSGQSVDDRRLMVAALSDRYRCPEYLLDCDLSGGLAAEAGYFRFGADTICYGRSASGYRTEEAASVLYDALADVKTDSSTVLLPFSPTEVIDNLRLERYAHYCWSDLPARARLLRDLYYIVRPWMSVKIRKRLQKAYLRGWQKIAFPRWPVDTTVEQLSEQLLLCVMRARNINRIPFVWFWPKGAQSCVAMTHDVEAQSGHDFCRELMAIDDGAGIKASFQIVPEGSYKVSESWLQEIRARGCDVNIQDLNHDGRLFCDRHEFLRRVGKINQYGKIYGARGFRAAVLYRNLDWYNALDFSY